VILGTVVLKELWSIGKLAGMGALIADGKLMADLGFSLERSKTAGAAQKGLIDLGTIRTHLKRIPRAESTKALYGHVGLLRARRWLRGHQYVADAVELEVPYGEDFEGRGRVWNPIEALLSLRLHTGTADECNLHRQTALHRGCLGPHQR